jgi:hypothetical protein
MSAQSKGPQEWSEIIAGAYAAGSKPPLTERLLAQVRETVQNACAKTDGLTTFGSEDIARINESLDHFEQALHAVHGPRLVAVDIDSSVAQMCYRSEADHPLRAFGGQ